MKLLILTIFLIGQHGTLLAAAEKSNLEFLIDLADTLVLYPKNALDKQDLDYVLLSTGDSGNSLNWLLQTRLIRCFGEIADVYVLGSGENKALTSDRRGVRIEFIPLSAKITYSKSDSVSAGRLVERRGYLSCTFVITRSDEGRVVWDEEVKCEQSDLVAESQIPAIEGEDFHFTKGRWSSDRFRGSHWKQAALVSGVTGLVVYLFYTIRSR